MTTAVTAGLALATLGSGVAHAQTVILVRHAEKAAEPAADPGLDPAGQARATALAEAVRGAHVTRVVTTSFRRTRDTAAPSATMAKVVAEAVPIVGTPAAHAAATAALVRASPKDAVVLVVGHSNTIPLIVDALGAKGADIPDCAFDRMTIVSLGGTPPTAVAVRYGAPSANCPG